MKGNYVSNVYTPVSITGNSFINAKWYWLVMVSFEALTVKRMLRK